MRLYESFIPSGNSYKVNLLLSQLGRDVPSTNVNILGFPAETRQPEFLKKNPDGRVPVLELDDGSFLPESNAILFYLAEGTPYLASSGVGRARTLQWMFFEQYAHEPYVAVLKFHTYWGDLSKLSDEFKDRLMKRGQHALDVMGQHLSTRSFFVEDSYSIADIALFAYTQSAGAIGYDVPREVEAWLERVRSQPRYVPIKRDPLGKAP